jgi:type IX secretion system PorP/SprF family membrane protein
MIKKRRHLFLFLVFLSLNSLILAQNYFVSNTYNNLTFTNPSFAQYNDYSLFQLNYRNQWPANNMYTSYGVAYFHNSDNLNSNFGAIVNYDQQYNGTFSQLAAGVNYAYKLKISRRSHFLFGLQTYYNHSAINYSGLTFQNDITASIPTNQLSQFPSVHAGIGILFPDKHFLGASVNNILSYTEPFTPKRSYSINYVGSLQVRGYYSEFYIEPMIRGYTDLTKVHIIYGSNINYYGFKAGLLLNQTNLSINGLIILLGINFENYEFVYTYDLNLSGVLTLNPKMATHEVTFLRKLQYKGRRNRRGAIKCPDI